MHIVDNDDTTPEETDSLSAVEDLISQAAAPADVLDEGLYFQTSQLVDSLRDTATAFLQYPPTGTAAIGAMVEQYNDLRGRVVTNVSGKYADETNKTIAALGSDADLHTVVFASTQLARWIDSIHVLPTYLLGQELQAASADEARTKLSEMLNKNSAAGEDTGRPGHYL